MRILCVGVVGIVGTTAGTGVAALAAEDTTAVVDCVRVEVVGAVGVIAMSSSRGSMGGDYSCGITNSGVSLSSNSLIRVFQYSSSSAVVALFWKNGFLLSRRVALISTWPRISCG